MAGVAAGDVSTLSRDRCVDLRIGVHQFPEQLGEGAEVEVADHRKGRVGNSDGDDRCLPGSVAEIAAAGKRPGILADSEEQQLECKSGRQRFEQLLENPGILTFKR